MVLHSDGVASPLGIGGFSRLDEGIGSYDGTTPAARVGKGE